MDARHNTAGAVRRINDMSNSFSTSRVASGSGTANRSMSSKRFHPPATTLFLLPQPTWKPVGSLREARIGSGIQADEGQQRQSINATDSIGVDQWFCLFWKFCRLGVIGRLEAGQIRPEPEPSHVGYALGRAIRRWPACNVQGPKPCQSDVMGAARRWAARRLQSFGAGPRSEFRVASRRVRGRGPRR